MKNLLRPLSQPVDALKWIVLVLAMIALIKFKATSSVISPETIHRKSASSFGETISLLVWDTGDGENVEARIEKNKLQNEFTSIDVTIKNQASGKILWSKKDVGFVLSAYTRDLTNDDGPEFIIVTTSGMIGETLTILSVNTTQASILLNEFYRGDAAIISLSNNAPAEIFITNAKSATGAFYTYRYKWDGRRYRLIGNVTYNDFIVAIDKVFKLKSVRAR